MVVAANASQFARGAFDTFIYPRLPFLGELQQARVGTTGAGVFATWHLRQASGGGGVLFLLPLVDEWWSA